MDFSPEQKYNLLSRMGYSGSPQGPEMDAFVQSNPGIAATMGKFSRVVKKREGFAAGGVTTPSLSGGQELTEAVIQDPTAMATKADVAKIVATPDTIMKPDTGQVKTPVPTADTTTVKKVEQAVTPKAQDAATMKAVTAAPAVAKEVSKTKVVTGKVSKPALVTAAQETQSSLEGMKAAQGTGILMGNPVAREIQDGELISGSAVDAAKVNQLTESIQAAEATPTKQATVAGQLEGLMQQFEGGNTPAWASGAMRSANAMLAQRGIGASSMAGQAVIQAAMESALPIAQADANTFAQFESQNLSNRQQTALFAAQQRATFLGQEFDQNFQTRVLNSAKVADVANMNFTAEQTIALENSRIANTVNLENLSNSQAMVMAKAAALSNLDITNLNNRQQAAVQNAQSFMQMDLTNLNNRQQVEMFRSQSNVNAILTDQAAKNAALQFNAASENQTNQFYDNLTANVSQFNAGQRNAIAQFNAGEANAIEKFNSQLTEQRSQFNANNSLVIAQANAVWRQNISTLNTAAQNEANANMAQTMNAMSSKAMDELWQSERDILAYSFTSAESAKDRTTSLLLSDKNTAANKAAQDAANKSNENTAMWTIAGKSLFGGWS